LSGETAVVWVGAEVSILGAVVDLIDTGGLDGTESTPEGAVGAGPGLVHAETVVVLDGEALGLVVVGTVGVGLLGHCRGGGGGACCSLLGLDVSGSEVTLVAEGDAVLLDEHPELVVGAQVAVVLGAVVDLVLAFLVQIIRVLTISAPPGTVLLGVRSVDAYTGVNLLCAAVSLVCTVGVSSGSWGCGLGWGGGGVLCIGQHQDCCTYKCS